MTRVMGFNGSGTIVAAPGATLGQYALVQELGAGGMGRVFEAKHIQLGKRVAIKLLHAVLVSSPSAIRRFLREGRACSRINDPHVVQVFDAGVQDGQPYLVMELVEGVNLAAWLRESGRVDRSALANLFLPLCSALWAVHQQGVVHRDLKPSNVILTRLRAGAIHPMLVDFGVAKLSFNEATDDLTNADSAVGTLAYMAPEQTRAAQAAQPLSDQYALGVMLYEAATGRRPFQGEGHYDLMDAILHDEVVPPSRYRSDLGPDFDALVFRALSRDPAQRFPSVHALGGALLTFADARAWGVWGPEFCETDVSSGGTEADAPRRDSRPSLDSEALAPVSWGSPATPARPKSARRKAAGATLLLAIGVAVCVSWAMPPADATVEREGGAAAVVSAPPAPKVILQYTEQLNTRTSAERREGPVHGSVHAEVSERRERPLSQAARASPERVVPKPPTAKPADSKYANESAVEPPRGTNGAFILE